MLFQLIHVNGCIQLNNGEGAAIEYQPAMQLEGILIASADVEG